jgi:nucleoside-diphosphate-sugar epimerase
MPPPVVVQPAQPAPQQFPPTPEPLPVPKVKPPIKDDAPPHPATHYGVYKVANEETARIYWEQHGIASMGFRPLSVYGPGRDFGLTADPAIAMKAAVLGRRFQIRWGGASDLIYVEDVCEALLRASASSRDGARVYNLHGASSSVVDVITLIEQARPAAKGLITRVEQPIPFPDHLDDARYQKDLGPRPPTPLADGVHRTLDEFARLQKDGRLDARELA